MLTHVNYRTGHMHACASDEAAHDAGAIVVWDLAHSAGAVPIDLHAAGADFAVGCGYKYSERRSRRAGVHLGRIRATRSGWIAKAGGRRCQAGSVTRSRSPSIRSTSRPNGIQRFICGTPPVLSLAALECGVDTVLAADDRGGMAAIRDKSIALTDLFIALVEERCADHGFTLVTPRDPGARGSQVSISHPEDGYAIMQALIARGVIGDFRAPDILRFGFTPLYTRFIDVWDAVDRLRQVMTSGEWRDPRFAVRSAVT